jgi:hypothetical protein
MTPVKQHAGALSLPAAAEMTGRMMADDDRQPGLRATRGDAQQIKDASPGVRQNMGRQLLITGKVNEIR